MPVSIADLGLLSAATVSPVVVDVAGCRARREAWAAAKTTGAAAEKVNQPIWAFT